MLKAACSVFNRVLQRHQGRRRKVMGVPDSCRGQGGRLAERREIKVCSVENAGKGGIARTKAHDPCRWRRKKYLQALMSGRQQASCEHIRPWPAAGPAVAGRRKAVGEHCVDGRKRSLRQEVFRKRLAGQGKGPVAETPGAHETGGPLWNQPRDPLNRSCGAPVSPDRGAHYRTGSAYRAALYAFCWIVEPGTGTLASCAGTEGRMM